MSDKSLAQDTGSEAAKAATPTARPGRVADLKAGNYSDGHPLDEVRRLECKLILKPDRFTGAKAFLEYGALVAKRGTRRPLFGEFAFQAKFQRRDELHENAMERMRAFFIALQQSGRDWLSLGATKTGMVYQLRGNAPQAHE